MLGTIEMNAAMVKAAAEKILERIKEQKKEYVDKMNSSWWNKLWMDTDSIDYGLIGMGSSYDARGLIRLADNSPDGKVVLTDKGLRAIEEYLPKKDVTNVN